MATAPTQFTEFIQQPPLIEIRGNIVFVRYGSCEHAMSVQCLSKGAERAQRALRQHAAGDDYVIIDD